MRAKDTESRRRADVAVDKLYGALRGRYGGCNARANGYRLQLYFHREQELILHALRDTNGVILDIACGSGLMVLPLASQSCQVVGVDFNETACQAACENGLVVFRGDAFHLPIASASIDRAISCQFLNQQSAANTRIFLTEAYRVLKPTGQLLIVWRNGQALIHTLAHELFRVSDWILSQPRFPIVNHSLDQLTRYASDVGFTVLERSVSFPLLRWRSRKINGVMAKLMGASNIIVVQKPTRIDEN